MYGIGEHIIHPGQGVCTVVGFTEDGPRPMMILEARQGHAKTRMLYPLSQEERLHPCISATEAESLIQGYGQLEYDGFTERNSSLEEAYFKSRLKLGAPETVRVAKTIRHRIREAEERDKKPSSYYARVLKEARRRSLEELAVALGVGEDEVDRRLQAAGAGPA